MRAGRVELQRLAVGGGQRAGERELHAKRRRQLERRAGGCGHAGRGDGGGGLDGGREQGGGGEEPGVGGGGDSRAHLEHGGRQHAEHLGARLVADFACGDGEGYQRLSRGADQRHRRALEQDAPREGGEALDAQLAAHGRKRLARDHPRGERGDAAGGGDGEGGELGGAAHGERRKRGRRSASDGDGGERGGGDGAARHGVRAQRQVCAERNRGEGGDARDRSARTEGGPVDKDLAVHRADDKVAGRAVRSAVRQRGGRLGEEQAGGQRGGGEGGGGGGGGADDEVVGRAAGEGRVADHKALRVERGAHLGGRERSCGERAEGAGVARGAADHHVVGRPSKQLC
mmetsp:Transcript_21363/g.54173  ORF Transcript_21363/g.54173 Transcript_21363/m.54173 type:complete len:344 (+) Transcript_21363:548-1579(+)